MIVGLRTLLQDLGSEQRDETGEQEDNTTYMYFRLAVKASSLLPSKSR